MNRLKIFVIYFLTLFSPVISAQVKIRLFSDRSPESVVFSVTGGRYEVDFFNGELLKVAKGEPVIISRFDGKLAVKARNSKGFICDSVQIKGLTGTDNFSLMVNVDIPLRQYYSGDLHCIPDFETLLLINTCDIEKYVAGAVRTEGGSGKHVEYFKTQAVITRTYMYKYFDKHMSDKYNICDNTHCQAYNGLSDDSVINLAVLDTKGEVILAPDSTLIIAAFHSNCGGETSSSEDVWLTSQPYLKSVTDPYCLISRNARWETSISRDEWLELILLAGYGGKEDDADQFTFVQKNRVTDYKSGSFTMPLRTIRTELNLRSTFFSVAPEGDSLKIKGRGYGHGVGLCQEGAMVMAVKGLNYKQIVSFYYTGVFISDIRNAVVKND